MKYTTLELEQGSPEWLEYRRKSVTSTDFCIIAAGKSLFDGKTVENLIFNKQNNIEIKSNSYMEKGKMHEPILLEDFNSEYNLMCMPKVVQSAVNQNIMASLDGIDIFSDDIIVEIKYTTREDIDILEEYYKYQVIHQMYTTGVEMGYLYIKQATGKVSVFIYTRELINELLSYNEWLQLCTDFLNKLNSLPDDKTLSLLDRYFELKNQIDILTEELDQIKPQIPEGVYNNYIVKTINKNTTNYSKYIKDNDIKIPEQYINTSSYLKISKKEIN